MAVFLGMTVFTSASEKPSANSNVSIEPSAMSNQLPVMANAELAVMELADSRNGDPTTRRNGLRKIP